MNFQDDFFQTGNQPISMRHLSQPYNNTGYHNFELRVNDRSSGRCDVTVIEANALSLAVELLL